MANETKTTRNRFSSMSWGDISQPGAYVCNESGTLYRIPPSALKEGHSPLVDIVGSNGEVTVTCVSANPYTPIEKLRLLCADGDILPNF